jgi:hypothetical protein
MEVLLCKEILLGPNCCVTPWKMLMSVVRFLRRSKPLARRALFLLPAKPVLGMPANFIFERAEGMDTSCR